jgi:mono/diheme cytochrome c family protein
MAVLAVPGRVACALLLGGACLAVASRATAAQEPTTPAQNVAAGARVFGEKGCSGCHAINGVGATVGPDLGRVGGVASAYGFAALMWNHLPAMASRMRTTGTAAPRVTPWEAADLVAFLFWAGYTSPRGDTTAGRRLFSEKRCIMCHQTRGIGGVIGPRLDGLSAQSPIDVAAAFWNHAATMEREMRERRIARPTITGQELGDLLAFLGSGPSSAEAGAVNVLPGNAAAGRELFRTKACVQCHRIGGEGGTRGPDLGAVPRRDPTAFAAAMWNKGPGMMQAMRAAGIAVPQLSGAEMADLVAYLGTLQYLAGEGAASRGRERLRSAGCLACHGLGGPGASGAGDLAGRSGLGTRAAVLAALWNHVALPESVLSGNWPTLEPGAVADLVAYFEMQGRGR